MRKNVAKETTIATDEASHYNSLNQDYYHGTVNHSQEGVGGRRVPHQQLPKATSHTSSVRCAGHIRTSAEKHIHRYLTEFDFRYSNRVKLGVDDALRTDRALRGIEGKRLTYRRIGRRDMNARRGLSAAPRSASSSCSFELFPGEDWGGDTLAAENKSVHP